MGRTNPTYRDRLRSLEERWGDYRHTLRRRDRDPFDRLWTHARTHADAAGFQNPPDPMDAVFLSVCLEHERTIVALEDRIAALESRIETLEAGPEDGTATHDPPPEDRETPPNATSITGDSPR
jgi:hypothetical protein